MTNKKLYCFSGALVICQGFFYVLVNFLYCLFTHQNYNLNTFYHLFFLKDGATYLSNATGPNYLYTFFPLTSIINKLFAPLFLNNFRIAAIFLQTVYLFFALIVIYKLCIFVTKNAQLGTLTLWVFILYPNSFLLRTNMSENLFTLLSALTILMVYKKRYYIASIYGILLGLCRPNSFLICILIILIIYFNDNKYNDFKIIFKKLLSIFSTFIGMGIYLVFCYVKTGNAFIYSKLNAEMWDQHFGVPLYSFFIASSKDNKTVLGSHLTEGFFYVIVALVMIAIIYTFRNVSKEWSIYGVIYILFFTCLQSSSISFLRFSLTCLPLIFAIANLICRENLYRKKYLNYKIALPILFVINLLCFLFWLKFEIIFT